MVIRKRLQERTEPAPVLASRMPEHPMPIERTQTCSQSIVYRRPVGQRGGCTHERQRRRSETASQTERRLPLREIGGGSADSAAGEGNFQVMNAALTSAPVSTS